MNQKGELTVAYWAAAAVARVAVLRARGAWRRADMMVAEAMAAWSKAISADDGVVAHAAVAYTLAVAVKVAAHAAWDAAADEWQSVRGPDDCL